MNALRFPNDLQPRRGGWSTRADINVTNVEKRNIYFAPEEPSFVSWVILWTERPGALKVSFMEAGGEAGAWPPTYNFNSEHVRYYLKTLVSQDGARSWRDAGWREDLDPLWEINPDHLIRHVFELPDGRLMRGYDHAIEGETDVTDFMYHTFDKGREGTGDFPFRPLRDFEFHPKFASIWTSDNGGERWTKTHAFTGRPAFTISALHPLRDGMIVGTGCYRVGYQDVTFSDYVVALTESRDCGETWTDPQVIAENDNKLIPQGMTDENDFVELDDGRLLMILRTDVSGAQGSCMRQTYLERGRSGSWQAVEPPRINPAFEHSGYPYMRRASDGTVFYYAHRAIKYSCDDGQTWADLPLGFSYYGQLAEIEPGRMLAMTQRNIGDAPYPWKCDASILQTTFDYERTGLVEQDDPDASGALALLDVGEATDFHAAMELRVDAASGLAYQVNESGYRFVAVTLPMNEFNAPGRAASGRQNAFVIVGEVQGGTTKITRKTCAGKVTPGSWMELQVTRKDDVLATAVKLSADEPASYSAVRDEGSRAGRLGLFTNRSTGAFRNIRFAAAGGQIRTNWLPTAGEREKD